MVRGPYSAVVLDGLSELDQRTRTALGCHTCGHDRDARVGFRLLVVVAQLLSLRPPKAYCHAPTGAMEELSGMPGYCFCVDPFHGS